MNTAAESRFVVLGAGITGLTAAYELHKKAQAERRNISVVVLESSSRVGGKIVTESRDGAVIEGGPDSFITYKPQALELVRELGLSLDLVGTEGDPKVSVLWEGRLKAIPQRRLLSFLLCDLFTWKGKARMALEYFLKPGPETLDESLAAFARRRLGPEAYERLIGPMLSGIYAGDPQQMSLAATFPQLREMERQGGLARAMLKRKARKADPELTTFMTLRGGLGRLVEALTLKLPPQTVRTGAPVSSLRRRGGQWHIQAGETVLSADAVICALPANALAQVVGDYDFELSHVLREIPFASTATVSMLFEPGALKSEPSGFGFIVPRSQGKATVAATYTSSKFPNRAPAGHALIRSFLGGAGRDACVDADDSQIARQARGELKEILGIGEAHPRLTRVFRWVRANPQYTVGHQLRLKRLDSCVQGHPGLVLAGCSYFGVGIPDCIRSGREAAAKALRAAAARAPAGVC